MTTTPVAPAQTPTPEDGRRRLRTGVLAAVAVAALGGGAALAGSGAGPAASGVSDPVPTDEVGATVTDADRSEPAEDDTAARPAADPVLVVSGLRDGDELSAAALETREVRVATDAAWRDTLRLVLDGDQLDADGTGPAVVARPHLEGLAPGEHVLEVAVGRGDHVVTRTVGFTVDVEAPTVSLPEVVESRGFRSPLTVEFEVGGADHVVAEGAQVELAGDGRATARFERTPPVVVVTASDAAGNATTAELPVVVHFPGGRAVHTTPSAWRYAPKREPIIELLEAGLIDAVQMDVKDELGDVGWDTDVEWADLSGAEDFNRNFDMAAAIETIHSYDARVIGRLTVYRDHRLAQWAWENGRADLVVQATDGTPYAGRYGEYAFTNFAHPEVQQYNLDIALEAAELGFDDILYDYIRRPDGAIEKLVIPGLGDRTPEEAVVEVMATAYPLLRERGVWVGASVFGIAIDRPTQMAQDIPMMAEHVDYIAPMVYPNHWNLGEYGVPVPEDAPYDIVERSLTLYREALEGTDTALMPWLQDFGGYGEAEVRAQIDATESVTGERSFLLWASSATYTHAALDPIPDRAPRG